MVDEVVGAVQDIAKTAVVLLQLDLVLHLVLAHKVRHIANTRTAERINALVVIADSKYGTAVLRYGTCELLDPCVLQFVGVLEFVNQDMTEASAVMFTDRIVIAQEFIRAQHQFAKIHHTLALALGFIEFIQLYFFTGVGVTYIHIFWAQTVFFAPSNEPHGLFGGETLFVYLKLFAQSFDSTELVLGIQNLKGLRQIG